MGGQQVAHDGTIGAPMNLDGRRGPCNPECRGQGLVQGRGPGAPRVQQRAVDVEQTNRHHCVGRPVSVNEFPVHSERGTVLQDLYRPPVAFAVVGCGQIARLHVERLLADDRARIGAVIDHDSARRAALQNEFALDAPGFDAIQPMLACGACQAAVVCTPTRLHFEQVRELRAAGLAVLCEKPLAHSRQAIAQLACEAGTGPLLSVAYQRRTWATFRTLRREIAGGRHGPVQTISVQCAECWQPGIAGTWRDDPAANPWGFIGDAGSHKIDMVFYLTGRRATEVFAVSEKRGSRVEITTSLIARLDDGALVTMSFTGDAHHLREDFHVHCARADLLLRDGRLFLARDNRCEPIEPLEEESNPVRAFLDSLVDGRGNVAPAHVALPVWEFTNAALESARRRVPVGIAQPGDQPDLSQPGTSSQQAP